MPSRTYMGPLATGRVILPTRPLPFTRGEPVEVTADEAELLDDDWSEPKRKRTPKGDKPDPPTNPDPVGDQPEPQETTP